MTVTIAELHVADTPEVWRAAGFAVADGGTCRIGSVTVRLLGPDAGRGVVGWTLSCRGANDGQQRPADVDGVPTTWVEGAVPPAGEVPPHPNGAQYVDHVVLLSPTSREPSPRCARRASSRAASVTASSADVPCGRCSTGSAR
ncbi:hypothetical protein L615_009200000070 [Nocardioides sp. J9]|uniref:hypothetical protein n=1 Tax=Nocardioides sp. J9 TaxID=935844 RepID=UPI0011AD4484|nr:hypothetical protein [Nocardioides sp. J9]TWG90173.1 hypothetical protein L615_009200000070 [Nocardioides sp. J9]